jgi:hypothetical protein
MASQFEKRKSKAKESTSVTNENLGETSAPETKVETGSGHTPLPNYDRTSYDIFRADGGDFLLVKVEYDLTTGAARVTSAKPIADSLPRAIQESQKLFVNKLMGIKGDR